MKASVERKAAGEVGHDAEPGEEGGSGGVEAGGVELVQGGIGARSRRAT